MIKQGDIVWLNFDPQAGNEQKGRRPALIVSNTKFHQITSYRNAMVCPITSTNNGFALNVSLDERTDTSGVIMCHQAKVFDITERQCEYREQLPSDILEEVLVHIEAIISLDH